MMPTTSGPQNNGSPNLGTEIVREFESPKPIFNTFQIIQKYIFKLLKKLEQQHTVIQTLGLELVCGLNDP